MNKLTAKKCLERIDKLKTSQRRFGISIFEEEYLEALEIALPVLEQQEVDSEALEVSREIMKIMYGPMPQGGSVQLMAQVQCLVIDAMKVAQGDKSLSRQQERGEGEWIEWRGGECPVQRGVRVITELRDKTILKEHFAHTLHWGHKIAGFAESRDIIAYRVVEQERERGEE